MFATCQIGGVDSCTPDICKTPAPPSPSPVPIPYPNVGTGCTAVGAIPHVLFMGGPAHSLATTIPFSSGDEPGVLGGITSQTIKGAVRHTVGSAKVILAGMPASRLSSATTQNNNNCFGARVVPSQIKVTIMS